MRQTSRGTEPVDGASLTIRLREQHDVSTLREADTGTSATPPELVAAIRAVQRNEFDRARTHIAEARAELERAAAATEGHGVVRHAGFVQDAQKEYAEANLTLAFVEGGPLPTADDLGVDAPAYLNGMAEAASELRRQVLDVLRAGDADRAEDLFAAMGSRTRRDFKRTEVLQAEIAKEEAES